MDDPANVEDRGEPASAEQVARRALILATISCRGIVENDAGSRDARKLWDRVAAWWTGLDLGGELEPEEAEILRAPFGTVPRQAAVNASWRAEALVVLGWALGRADMPPHDEQADPAAIATSLGFLERVTVLDSPTLRPPFELEAYRQVALTVHWRLREFSLRPVAIDFPALCERSWFGPLSLEGVRLVGDDLDVGGVALADAPPSAVATAASIAQERHQAINWICDAAVPFSDTDTST